MSFELVLQMTKIVWKDMQIKREKGRTFPMQDEFCEKVQVLTRLPT